MTSELVAVYLLNQILRKQAFYRPPAPRPEMPTRMPLATHTSVPLSRSGGQQTVPPIPEPTQQTAKPNPPPPDWMPSWMKPTYSAGQWIAKALYPGLR